MRINQNQNALKSKHLRQKKTLIVWSCCTFSLSNHSLYDDVFALFCVQQSTHQFVVNNIHVNTHTYTYIHTFTQCGDERKFLPPLSRAHSNGIQSHVQSVQLAQHSSGLFWRLFNRQIRRSAMGVLYMLVDDIPGTIMRDHRRAI